MARIIPHFLTFPFALCLTGVSLNVVAQEAERPNSPPIITHSTIHQVFDTEPYESRVDRPVRFILYGSDAEQDTFTLAAEGLPEGAWFDAEVGEFLWTPNNTQLGEHRVKFTVTDGKDSTSKIVRLRVVPNRAPVGEPTYRVKHRSGESLHLVLRARDDDRDILTYHLENPPPGSRFNPTDGHLEWTPTDSQTGLYVLKGHATDGELTSGPIIQEVEIVEEWESVFLPGAYFQAYLPNNSALGTYMGVGLELVPFSWIHLNDNRGPSHGRIYIRGELLNSSEKETPVAFIYGFGTSLSVERNPSRRWLIPYFGFDLGGLLQEDTGHNFHITPHTGLYFWISRNVSFGVQGGYLIAPSDLEGLRGWKITTGGNFTLW